MKFQTDQVAYKNVLVSVLGLNAKRCEYSWQGKKHTSKLATTALYEFLDKDQKPELIIAVCTPEAHKETLPILKDEINDACDVKDIVIEDTTPQPFIEKICLELSQQTPLNLTIDLTHGFRHFPVYLYATSLFLASFSNVIVSNTFYALLKNTGDNKSEGTFVQLNSLFDLIQWTYALQLFEKTGNQTIIIDLIKKTQSNRYQKLIKTLKQVSFSYSNGFPLELGWYAQKYLDEQSNNFRKLLKNHYRLPMSRKLSEIIDNWIRTFALTPDMKKVSGNWKQQITLTKKELERQVSIIDSLLMHNELVAALGLMSEWIISWLIWVEYENKTTWLDYGNMRGPVSARLNRLVNIYQNSELRDILTEPQKDLVNFIILLKNLRNSLHHHGMRLQDITKDVSNKRRSDFQKVITLWNEIYKIVQTNVSLDVRSKEHVTTLVTPVGTQEGTLHNAVHACESDLSKSVDFFIFICSEETRIHIDNLIKQKNISKFSTILFKDPYKGVDEFEEYIEILKKDLILSEKIYVNMTGGTTLFGLFADRIVREATQWQIPVRRFGLIMTAEPTSEHPYGISKAYWMDENANTSRHR